MGMNTDQVKSLIGRITYKPGWTFTVVSDYNYINLQIYWPVPETDPENAPEYKEIQTYENERNLSIYPNEYNDEVEVMRTILEQCIAWELEALVHEAREFFRVKPEMSWAAPFHPHHKRGQNPDSLLQGQNGAINWGNTMHRGLERNKQLPQYTD